MKDYRSSTRRPARVEGISSGGQRVPGSLRCAGALALLRGHRPLDTIPRTTSGRLGPRAATLGLLLLTAGALALRLSALDATLPHVADQDSIVFHNQVEHLEAGHPNPEEDFTFGYYPLLVARLTVLFFDPAPTSPPATGLAEHFARASAPHVHLRIVVALLSTLIVPATILLARAFLSAWASLVAAAFMATSTLHLWFSWQARPHAASAAFALIAVLAALHLRRHRGVLDWLAAGIALGLAIGSLESGVFALLPFGAAIVLPETSARKFSWLGPALAIAALSLCVWLFYPFLFVESQGRDAARLAAHGGTLDLFGHLIFLEHFKGAGFARVFGALRDYEPWIALLAVAGLALALLRVKRAAWKDLAVVLAFALPYLLVFGLYARTYQRFVIPLLPYLCVLAAYLADRIRPKRSLVLAVATLALLLGPQVWLAMKVTAARRAPDTLALAAVWLQRNLSPSDRILVMPTFDLPLPVTAASLEASVDEFDNPTRPWFHYQRGLPPAERPVPGWNLVAIPLSTDAERARAAADPAGYLREQHAGYAVIDAYEPGRRPLVLGAIRRGLEECADLVARIVPDAVDAGEDLPIVGQDDEFPRANVWAWRAARARCMGPVIEIWKLRS